MKKRTIYTEFAFAAGLFLLAAGTACMEYGGFGISMVAAPAYVIYLKISDFLPGFGFGTAGYLTEALILLCMICIVRRAKLTYLLSFITAVSYGILLDSISPLTGFLPESNPAVQIPMYILGVLLCACAISLLFRAYFPPAAHEMFVKEVSASRKIRITLLKTLYDCALLLIALILSLIFFGNIQGIGIGTVVCAFINGGLIRLFTLLTDKIFAFRDGFPIRHWFEEREEPV